MRIGRAAGALALTAVTATGTSVLTAGAASASVVTHDAADVGLFGASDPTYDGAFRQSLGILAEHSAGVADAAAVHWLVAQQCPDGGWTAYRADLSKPCPATDLTSFTGEDSNSTALAVQALHAVGVTPKYDALAFLHGLQDADGGFPLLAGSGTDANSTALVVQAVRAVGQDPTGAAWTKSGHPPLDALMASWIGCAASGPQPADLGAFSSAYSAGHGDLTSTVQAVWGVEQKPLPITGPATAAQPTVDCSGGGTVTPAQAGQDAATWLAGQLHSGGYLTTGSTPDGGLTAQGILAMVASGTNSAAITSALDYLSAHVSTLIRDSHGNVSPGTVGYLALAAYGAGRSVTSFGGLDLITTLRSTQRALPAAPHGGTVHSVGNSHPGTTKGTPGTTARAGTHATVRAAGSTLPATGRASWGQTVLGAALVGAGVLLSFAGRRRRA